MYIYLTCGLLAITAVSFLFAIIHAAAIARKQELMLYRVVGASERTTNTIVIIENTITTLLATIMVLIMTYGLFNIVTGVFVLAGIFKSSLSYALPVVVVLGVLLFVSILISIITLAAAKTARHGNVTELLRTE